MKNLFTLVRRRGSKSFELAIGPDASTREHRAFVKRLRFERADSAYDEVVVARSIRRHRLSKIEPKPKRETKPKTKPKPNIGQRVVGAIAQRFLGK